MTKAYTYSTFVFSFMNDGVRFVARRNDGESTGKKNVCWVLEGYLQVRTKKKNDSGQQRRERRRVRLK
jgi:hypothetical protein